MMRSLLMVLIVLPGAVSTSMADEPTGYRYSLFDGESLAAWVVEGDCEAVVQDGAILLKSGDGWLRSHHEYADFRLHVEWKALKDADYDAGIFFHASREGQPFPKTNYQVNLLDGKEGHINRLPGATTDGLVQRGEWNTLEITVRGKSVALDVNGKHAYTTEGLEIPRGYVGIQIEVPKGGQFLLRNLWIEELGFTSLLDSNELTHWEGAGRPASECWELSDGVLTCVKPKGPWLRSLKEYADFDLRLEYRVGSGGNSGVYVRVPENGNHHRSDEAKPPAGFEVQVLDDSSSKYRTLKAYQYSASVYDIAGAEPRVSRPPGEWNTLEINCRGHEVRTIHNGVPVVQVTAESHPPITLRKLKGYLGLQNHGVGVSFRNIRIGPAL